MIRRKLEGDLNNHADNFFDILAENDDSEQKEQQKLGEMPPKPKKEKTEQFTGDEASGIILDYLVKQNRPYSATEVSANLHNAVTKPTATKILKELHDAGEIEGRVAGKQIVYHAKQDPSLSISEAEFKALDDEYSAVKEESGTLKQQLKELQTATKGVAGGGMNGPTAEQLEIQVEMMEKEVEKLEGAVEAKLGAMKGAEMVDPKAREKERKELERVRKEAERRKQQFQTFWDALTENYEGDKEALWEQIGLDELDDD